MRPEKLTIRNIGPFRGTHTVDFSELGDIFLVYGKTGAGKTTVFDSLSYAFYGEAPGERKGLARQMRSQFAPDTEESAVELEFTLAGTRYRIRRSLPSERVSARSGKLQNVAEEVTFDRRGKTGWESLTSTNKTETDRRILDLIGLSSEEFSRIVLLPQGEFARFLRQNSTERKTVLAKLFPVEQYARVTELARGKARIAELELKETEKNIQAMQAEFSRPGYERDRAALDGEAETLRAAQAGLRQELSGLSAQLEQARAAAARRAELEAEKARLAALEGREEDIRARTVTLLAARRAEPLLEQLSGLEGLASRLAELTAEQAAVEKESLSATDALAALEAETPRITGLASEKEALLLRKEQLRIAVSIAETLEAETAVLDGNRRKAASIRKEAADIRTADAPVAAKIESLGRETGRLDECMKADSLARDDLERLKQLKNLAEDCDREKKAIRAHSGAAEQSRLSILENRKDAEIAKAELAVLEEEERNGKALEQAGILAESLAEGKPCPVCGSTSHPRPAMRTGDGSFGFADRIAAANRRIELLDRRHTELGAELAGRRANLETAEDRLRQVLSRYRECSPAECPDPASMDIPAPEEAAVLVRKAVLVMQEASDALARVRAAIRETEELRLRHAGSESALARLAEALSALESEIAGEESSIRHGRERYLEAFPETPPAAGITDAAEALELCSARILAVEAERNRHESGLQELRSRLSVIEGRRAALEATTGRLASEAREASARFAASCAQAGFTDGKAVREASRTHAEQDELETAIAAFTREKNGTAGNIKRLEGEAASWNGPGPETVEAAMAGLEVRIQENGRELEERTGRIATLDMLKKRWDDLESERSRRTAMNGRLAALANDLTGANPAKTSFDAWILGMYLEEITAYANTRLERMSEGRYRIQLNDSYRRGNSLAGLDLEIRDAYTGRTRPSGTLSGGESFMASISLALGLADSIQSRSGGIQLDAVFIDEGFGSLDESSLERAITILDEIRGQRMVGLISHVADLRTRIPNRIEIVKTGAGSTIRKETCND